MTRGFSLYLDAVRVTAALIVLLSHLAFSWASGGQLQLLRDLNIGSDFVIVFFVLSGLVIAHTTTVKDKNFSDYAIARLSRLYSVVIPALVLTWACHFLGILIADIPSRLADIPHELARSLTFTNYVGGDADHVVGNGPFWSVTYEFWYYVLFAAWLYLGGPVRILTLGLLGYIIGVPILLLAPAWLFGMAVYYAIRRGWHHVLSLPVASLVCLVPIALYALGLMSGAPDALTAFTETRLLGGASSWEVLHFSDEFIWNNIIAVLVGVHFFAAARLLSSVFMPTSLASTISWWAGRTFSLYLFHLPLMKLISRMPGYDASDIRHVTFNGVTTIILCLLLASATERRVHAWRAGMRHLAARLPLLPNRLRGAAI